MSSDAPEAVGVFDPEQDRVSRERGHLSEVGIGVAEPGSGRAQPEAAAETGLEELGVATASDPTNRSAGPSRRCRPRRAVTELTPVSPPCGAPPGTGAIQGHESRSCRSRHSPHRGPRRPRTPKGRSTAGNRHVTGRDDPAMKWKTHRPGRLDHVLGPVPVPGEVLVVEDRDRSPAALEDVDGLLEEFVPRIERLPLVVARVLAVLADDQARHRRRAGLLRR